MGTMERMRSVKGFDAIVVGEGAAGLTAALKLAPLRTLVISKTKERYSGCSHLAQGGIAAAVGPGDSPELHFEDTLTAGAGSCETTMVRVLTEEAKTAVEFLESLGMPFDRDRSGEFVLNREGSHSVPRILRAGGDSTGRALMDALQKAAEKAEHITVQRGAMAWQILTGNNGVTGLLAFEAEKGWTRVDAPFLIFASGGAGQLFQYTTNPAEATGDAMAMAIRGGLPVRDLEMIQFHPTALKAGIGETRLPLVTEALRGEGARLITRDGTPVMNGVHHLGDLAPRDIVARQIWDVISRGEEVFLDISGISNFSSRFPTVSRLAGERGISVEEGLLPVIPAAHYTMGGVTATSEGRTPLIGLFAIGEAAGTGVHGANRLASNSLLECLVSGTRSAHQIKTEMKTRDPEQDRGGETIITLKAYPPGFQSTWPDLRKEIQRIMWHHFGLKRSKEGMAVGMEELNRIGTIFKLHSEGVTSQNALPAEPYEETVMMLEAINLITLAREVGKAAQANPESRGAHFITY